MNFYKWASKFNDVKAVKNGRIGKRIYNRQIMKAFMKMARKLMK